MINIKINDFEFLVKPHISILDACKYAGINVPRFCYHETLSISGNCRMCLVEIEGMEKPLASCVAEVDEGMSIWVDTPFVKKARENVVETLLLNHPLDCPICDQAGECDLQDQTKTFGSSYSRFFFKKKSVEDKYCGPLIKTIMTRCITCTRCVRYAAEVAGVEFFGTINRGSGTEIGAYVSKMFDSEISGNVIDLCPVGALTSKPYAFKARPWELRLSESIDITDSLGANIYVNFKETEIFRVVPKNNNDINGSIISDKARFSYDANHNNRINNIFDCDIKSKEFTKISWLKFFKKVDSLVETLKFDILVDEKCDLETLSLLKKLVNKYPNKLQLISVTKTNSKGNFYTANQSNLIDTINQNEEAIVLLGTNLRLENSILNAFIRFKYKNTLANLYSFGLTYKENIPTNFVNLSSTAVLTLLQGKLKKLSKILIGTKTPLIIIGENFADRLDNVKNFTNLISAYLPGVKFVSVNNTANSEGLQLLSLTQTSIKAIKNSVIAINLDDNIVLRKLLKATKNTLWLNTHGSFFATKFDTIVPTLTSFETEQVYISLEGRPQKTQKSFASFFDVKSSFDTVASLFNVSNSDLIESKENYLSATVEQVKNADLYASLKETKSPFKHVLSTFTKQKLIAYPVSISKYPVKQKQKNFYCSDTLTLNSQTMALCSVDSKRSFTNF